MHNEKIISILSKTDLFQKADSGAISSVLTENNARLVSYKNTETIFSSKKYKNSVGVIVKGSAKVFKSGGEVLVSRLSEGDIFGCQALFIGGEFFPNVIVSCGETVVLYLDKSVIVDLMEADINFAFDYIRYLSRRIHFLNRRIENFTGGSAESRLAGYLLSCFGGERTYVLDRSMTQLSFSLDISRASLYRAFDSLISCGIIEKEGKEIKLVDKEGLISLIS